MNRRKFITTCTSCACASMGAVLLNNINTHNESGRYLLRRHLGIHLAEHCNLGCKYCAHYSCVAEKEFYDLDKFNQDMKQMSYIFNGQIRGINLMGGEPLLNPDINEYIKITRKYFPKAPIDILTNGILLDDMDEAFWKTVDENKVSILPTLYPVKGIKINWESVLKKAEKHNILIYGNYIYGNHKRNEKLTLDNIDKFYKKYFSKMKLDEKRQDKTDRSKCVHRKFANCMHDGKLYPCAAFAYIRHLNKKFGTNFKVTDKDYIDLYKAKDISEVEKFMEQPQQYPFCGYCTPDAAEPEWENSAEHDISEWT